MIKFNENDGTFTIKDYVERKPFALYDSRDEIKLLFKKNFEKISSLDIQTNLLASPKTLRDEILGTIFEYGKNLKALKIEMNTTGHAYGPARLFSDISSNLKNLESIDCTFYCNGIAMHEGNRLSESCQNIVQTMNQNPNLLSLKVKFKSVKNDLVSPKDAPKRHPEKGIRKLCDQILPKLRKSIEERCKNLKTLNIEVFPVYYRGLWAKADRRFSLCDEKILQILEQREGLVKNAGKQGANFKNKSL